MSSKPRFAKGDKVYLEAYSDPLMGWEEEEDLEVVEFTKEGSYVLFSTYNPEELMNGENRVSVLRKVQGGWTQHVSPSIIWKDKTEYILHMLEKS